MRWGFLGASRIGRRALAPAVLGAGHTLHAVAARDLARAEAFATEFGAGRAYGDYDSLLADPAIDAVYVGLPNDAHLPWTLRALAAGKHVLCEKPLTLTAAEVATMQDAATRAGRRVMEAFCHVHHPQIHRLRALQQAGAIGDVVAMLGTFGTAMGENEELRWEARYGGGALYDLGCYCVSLMRVLVGREPQRVTAVQSLRGDVDAHFSGMLDFGGGIAGQFACSFASGRTQEFTLLGAKERVHLNWPISTKGRATRLQWGDIVEDFPSTDPYIAMVEYFASPEDEFGLAWSLAQAVVLDALFTSARTGQVVGIG